MCNSLGTMLLCCGHLKYSEVFQSLRINGTIRKQAGEGGLSEWISLLSSAASESEVFVTIRPIEEI